ncbi:hypothetical protein [Methylorubrum populi]|uniref:Alcohol dehydrogenase n=1 Tax=Methylorubrum populi TaxID=223967 RepID=A0A833J3I7_9HYPH|nr:alcohol dehydrogenase [Methylorubrum populi]
MFTCTDDAAARAETQDMLEICGRHGITADIELIPIDQIETACSRMLESDVKDRFVIDIACLPEAA